MNGAERLALMAAHSNPDYVHPLLLSWEQYCACSASVPDLPSPERGLGIERWEPIVVGDRVLCWPTAAMLDAVEASIGGPHLELRAAIAAARACPVARPDRRTVASFDSEVSKGLRAKLATGKRRHIAADRQEGLDAA